MKKIIVDAYGEKEKAMRWYYYLKGKMKFSFKAKCICTKAGLVREESILQGFFHLQKEAYARQGFFLW